MSFATKVRITATTIVLVAAGALAYEMFEPDGGGPLRLRFDDVELVLHVRTSAGARPSVGVQLSNTLPVTEEMTVNPWETVVKVPMATRVILSVVQRQRGHTECHILREGVVKDHNEMFGPGTITCQHVVE